MRKYLPSMTVSMKHFDNLWGKGWTRRPDEWFDKVRSMYQYEDGTWMINYLDGQSEKLGDHENKYEFNFANLEEEE